MNLEDVLIVPKFRIKTVFDEFASLDLCDANGVR